MGAVFKKEFRSYFTSPLGYVFISSITLCGGLLFTFFNLLIYNSNLSLFFKFFPVVLAILIPLLTMKSLSDEKKSKTDQILLTAPVSLWSIIGGKFFAAFTLYAISLSNILIYQLIITLFGKPDYTFVIGNLFGLLLLGGALIAIGIFMSSITESQIVAVILSMVLLLILASIDFFIIPLINNNIIATIVKFFSIFNRFFVFSIGVLSIDTIVFYISLTLIFMFLTVRRLEKHRWS